MSNGNPITLSPILPKDMLLGIGIPTSETKFLEQLHPRDGKHDFAQNFFAGSLQKYRQEVLLPFERYLPVIEKTGVYVIRDWSFLTFKTLMRKGEFKVVTIFSHWNNRAIEFTEGMIDICEIASSIPCVPPKIIDLCVCNPLDLIPLLKQKCSANTVKYTSIETVPGFWIAFYALVAKNLEEQSFTFGDAWSKTARSLELPKDPERYI
jgi:hypothetical protein